MGFFLRKAMKALSLNQGKTRNGCTKPSPTIMNPSPYKTYNTMTEEALLNLIEQYTQEHKRMPTIICGPFKKLCNIFHFTRLRTEYHTPTGTLKFQLDPDAEDIYLGEEPA